MRVLGSARESRDPLRLWPWPCTKGVFTLNAENPYRLLIVDDDPELCTLLRRFLSQQGFSVRAVQNGADFLASHSRDPADLIVLDVMLPDQDGFELCRALRSEGDETPILMLTARGSLLDRIAGLEMGADDYMAKPFTPLELSARISAVLRRLSRRSTNILNGVVEFGPYRLVGGKSALLKNGEPMTISSREMSVLKALASNPGRPISRAQLISRALGRNVAISERAIDVQIVRLRRLIEEDPANPRWIKTVWGLGYMLCQDDE